MSPTLLGFAMIGTFMALVLTRRLSAVSALILAPVVFGTLGGFGPQLGKMMVGGVVDVAPTALMLIFAVLYFGVMIEAGLFDPLVRRVLKFAGDDPLRISVGTAVLAMAVSLDGDGATTVLVTISAMLPVYRRLGMNPLILATLLGLSNTVMNWLPWGGPAARAASALHVDVMQIVGPMLPAMGLTLVAILGLSYGFGLMERRRLAAGDTSLSAGFEAKAAQAVAATPERQVRNLWLNLALTLGLVVGMVTGVAPLPVLMMGGFALAATLNFPELNEQRRRLATQGETVLTMASLIFAAGAFTGVLSGAGMADGMAQSLVQAIPSAWGPYLGPLTGLASLPLLFFLSSDAFYFGIVPVLGATGATYGVAPEVIARAALIGMPLHGLSPLIAPIYLVSSLIRADIGSLQRFALPWALATSIIALAAAMATGAIPLPA